MLVSIKTLVAALMMTLPAAKSQDFALKPSFDLRRARLRRLVEKCPEHLFSTDDSEMKPLG